MCVVIKNLEYRIYPTKEQQGVLCDWLGMHCDLYNCALSERKDAWRKNRISLSLYDQFNELPGLKKDFPGYISLGSHALRGTIKRVDRAYQNFFRRVKAGERVGYPRFKSKIRFDSFCYPSSQNWRVDCAGDRLIINVTNLGDLKAKGRQRFDIEKLERRALTIKRKNNKWYAIICFRIDESLVKREVSESRTAIGIDAGIAQLLVTSDGEYIENPKFLKSCEKEIKLQQRKLSKKIKGSNSRRKQVKRLAKKHEKLSNKRKDHHHKLSAYLVKHHDVIVVEKLNLTGMTKSAKGTVENPGKNVAQKSGLNRSMLDAGIGMLYQFIGYKAEEAGCQFVQINPKNTSRKCSKCGHAEKENRVSQSMFICKRCGHTENADENASKNILAAGYAAIAGGGPNGVVEARTLHMED